MKTKPRESILVVLEGPEACGKTTVLEHWYSQNSHRNLIITREPGGTEYGEAIRQVSLHHPLAGEASGLTMQLLMYAPRFHHLERKIEPAIRSGRDVITDRFVASTFAYNVVAMNKDPETRKAVEEVFWFLYKKLSLQPHLTVYFDVKAEEGMRRAAKRKKAGGDHNHFDQKAIDFYRAVQAGYREFLPTVNHVIIDANQSFEKVYADFAKLMDEELT